MARWRAAAHSKPAAIRVCKSFTDNDQYTAIVLMKHTCTYSPSVCRSVHSISDWDLLSHCKPFLLDRLAATDDDGRDRHRHPRSLCAAAFSAPDALHLSVGFSRLSLGNDGNRLHLLVPAIESSGSIKVLTIESGDNDDDDDIHGEEMRFDSPHFPGMVFWHNILYCLLVSMNREDWIIISNNNLTAPCFPRQ